VAGRLKTELSKEGRSITIGIPQVTIVEAWSAPIQDMETAFILESLGCPIVLGLSADIDH
ncbi:MAG: hypothetical protein KKA42_05175, partial [candidate division Zixibacteria bacterium]|nr:hypothetical protein [candidate division Zixibacteria bacterium]